MTWPYWETISSTTPLRVKLCKTATSIKPVGFLVPPPMRPIASFGSSKNVESLSIHCSCSCLRWTKMSVLTLRLEINQAPITVFPKAVVADRTPKSVFRRVSAAIFCSLLNSPKNFVFKGVPFCSSS